MLKTLLVSIVCAVVINNTSVLNLFQTDYDADLYEVTQVEFNIPNNVPKGWYPLRDISNYLPIEVSWDNNTREIVVVSEHMKHLRPLLAERRYKADKLPSSLVIQNGITYCAPKFLTQSLSGISFIYNNNLYVFNGEAVESKLIKNEGSTRFKEFTLTSMYRLKLVMPDVYKMVQNNLTGGIMYDSNRDKFPLSAIGYVYPNRKNPVCCMLHDYYYGAELASYIAHEAYHVYQYRKDGISYERDANNFEKEILNTLIKSMY